MPKQLYTFGCSPIGDDVLDKLRDVRRRLCELRDETQEIIETLAELDHLLRVPAHRRAGCDS